MRTPVKKNIAGYRDNFGMFRPIRSPKFVGSTKRKATPKDRKAYSKKLAGDLDDVFDREIRKERNRKKADKLYEERVMRELHREAYGTRSGGRLAQSLVEFVRSEGGIRRTYKFGGKKLRGKRVSYDAGELAPFTYKESGKRGLVTDKGGKTLDGMFQAAREAGFPVRDENDLLDRMDEEIRGNGATYATHGYLDYRDNPKSKTRTRTARNPMHPVSAFAAGTSGILSALQIREMVKRTKSKKKVRRRKANPKSKVATPRKRRKPVRKAKPATKRTTAKTKAVKRKKRTATVAKKRTRKTTTARKRATPKRKTVARKKVTAKRTVARRKTNSAKRTAVPRRRTFEMFQGRQATNARQLSVSAHAPGRLDQLGDLIELKLNSGRVLKFSGKKFKLCAAKGKLWIAGGKFAKPNPAGKAREINPIDAIDHVVYGTYKPHHGDMRYTHYIHKLGEETGHMPTLCVDREGYPIIRGGRYKIEARGIVN